MPSPRSFLPFPVGGISFGDVLPHFPMTDMKRAHQLALGIVDEELDIARFGKLVGNPGLRIERIGEVLSQ